MSKEESKGYIEEFLGVYHSASIDGVDMNSKTAAFVINEKRKAVREAFKEMKEELKEIEDKTNEEEKQKPLLVIELENEDSVPKVIYKGEEIKYKQNISFDWETTTEQLDSGGLTYAIQHQEVGVGYPCNNRIERRVGCHALD